MSRKILIVMLLILSLVGCKTKSYKVVGVVDGDTIIVYPNTPVRIIGIDAPELKSESLKFSDDVALHMTTKEKEIEFAQISKTELTNLLLNKKVTLKELENFDAEVLENGRSGRSLRYVYLKKDDVGKLMLQKGFARIWKSIDLNIMPHHDKETEYQREEYIAKELNVGIWKNKTEENPE